MILTTSLETSKKLKDAGFNQKGEFYYLIDSLLYEPNVIWYKEQLDWSKLASRELYLAATTDEILSELPVTIKTTYGHYNKEVYLYMNIYRHSDDRKGYEVSYTPMFNEEAKEWFNQRFIDKLPEALSQCWIWLKSEGIIK